MKRTLLFFLFIFCILSLQAQPKIKDKKYPSLLWEITGNGAKKPSYLIGTMHVSSKIAFHLPDSFYIAIRNAQVVALETNPETWQEDMSRYDVVADNYNTYNRFYSSYKSIPDDYLNINTLKFYKYESKIERALYSNPSSINNLLYRSYGNDASDFEEDTYLDMYIFQCGKKWGKKVTGVENYGESMKLMSEAYKDASKDKNRKERSYDGADEYSVDKLQEAYRNGNLDLLDSINKYNSTSAAFDEKFLYRRNEIQAYSIDSIIRSGSALFAGVGAAHLPGERGVIEILRKKGYRLRPVKMGERDSRDKDIVDKIRVPVVFRTTTADDGFFKVDIPGKFYPQDPAGKFGEDVAMDQKQYADMSNGSYYIVTRIMTNAWMWSHYTDDIFKIIDSLLYENVPGKIISKTTIFKNGYKGFDLMSRTRRGDLQRYNIFITPFEIIFFKMSGNADYVKQGNEANLFFESIKFKEYKAVADPPAGEWKKYSPPYGGFAVALPHDPYIGNDGSWIYDAEDKASGTQYRVIRTDIHNFHFVEEDSFDLGLMNESFMSSAFIDTQLYSKPTSHNGYPALDGKYKDKGNSVFLTRFIIQGPHYYTLIAHGKKEIPAMKNFLNSFEIKPFIYNEPVPHRDTSLYFTVTTPVYPEDKKIKLDIPRHSFPGSDGDEESEDEQLYGGAYRNKTISNDSTGEKIYVSFYRPSAYYYIKDSAATSLIKEASFFDDSSCVYRMKKKTELPDNTKPDGYRVWETIITDTGSSRTLWTKTYYKDGMVFSLAAQSDTLSQPGAFLKNFFETFTPDDSVKGINPFVKKSNLFFDDFMNKDSVKHKRAIKHMDDIELDAADLPQLKKAIAWLHWGEKKYLGTKRSLIYKLANIKINASSDYLKELYYALDDTVQLQYAVLVSLLQHRTNYAFTIFRDIVNKEPPVVEAGPMERDMTPVPVLSSWGIRPYRIINGNFLDELSDSLQLAKNILPDLLPLLHLEDYKSSIMKLLGEMVDSNLVKPKDYEMYFSKFLVEARQELKKQSVAEKKKAIENAEESKEKRKIVKYYPGDDENDSGNDDLHLYATLLLPFRETNPSVQPLIEQMLGSKDKKLKYNTMLLLLQQHQTFPDTLLNYFGSLDDYRYKLYNDLKRLNRQERFPEKYNNHIDLGRSSLLGKRSYDKPDTLVFVDRLGANFKDKKGFIYFYKYKTRKDDLSWKLAIVGLVPEDPKQFEFGHSYKTGTPVFNPTLYPHFGYKPFDFTEFTGTKIEPDELIGKQLNKVLKKILYSRRNSARKFYEDNDERSVVPYLID